MPRSPLNDDDFEYAINNSFVVKDLATIYNFKNQIDKTKLQTLDVGARNREVMRLRRSKLQSSNGDTVEIYDQFYRDHKLLLVLFRALAVMPIVRDRPGHISFKWISIATIYAVVFWTIMTIVVIYIGRERLIILITIEEFDEYIYSVIFVFYLFPHFWTPFVGWSTAKEVARYKTSWGTFQLRYFRVTGKMLLFPGLKLKIMIICFSCLLFAVLFLISLSLLLDGFPMWHTIAYYHIITIVNMNCALWYINCKAIGIASEALSERFRLDIQRDKTAAVISQYRFLWLNLSELLQALGNAYARQYSMYCIFMFVNICIAVYGAFAEMFEHGFRGSLKEFGLAIDIVYCIILLFIFLDCSHNATLQVASGVQNTLLSLDLKTLDIQAQKEIDLFIIAIEMNPAIVSLKGYLVVNRELLSSYIGTITVYLLVLIQFKFSLGKDPAMER